MRINTNDHDFDGKKTVKLQLPKEQLVRLKSQKVLTGETISEIAGEALTEYFDKEQTQKATNE